MKDAVEMKLTSELLRESIEGGIKPLDKGLKLIATVKINDRDTKQRDSLIATKAMLEHAKNEFIKLGQRWSDPDMLAKPESLRSYAVELTALISQMRGISGDKQ